MARSTKNERLKTLYERLSPSGFKRKLLHEVVLPDWWEDSIADSDAGFGQMLVLISRALGVDIRTLENSNVAFEGSDALPVRLKKRSNANAADVWVPRFAATRVGQLAVRATPSDYIPIPSDPLTIRAGILQTNPSGVTLEALLDFCWEHGLPVVTAMALPKGGLKGLAVQVQGRPAIVLLQNDKLSADMAFVLAHELGHIAAGHLDDDDVYVEEEKLSNPLEETQADAFANYLLVGNYKLYHRQEFINSTGLIRFAELEAQNAKVYLGSMIRHLGGKTNAYPLAAQALRIVEPNADAPTKVRAFAERHLDFERLPPESAAYLQRVSGLEEAQTSEAVAA